MARTAAGDKRFLELHHGKYRVVMTVPKVLRKAMGTTKLKRQLGTDSLAVANETKWAVVKDLKEEILAFERQTFGAGRADRQAVLQQASELAKTLSDYGPEERGGLARAIVEDTVQGILGKPVGYREVSPWMARTGEAGDAGTRIPVYDPNRERLADDFVNVAMNGGLPIANADAAYKEKRLRVSPRTEDDHDRALRMLGAFCICQGLGDDATKVDEYVVADFVAHLENEHGMAARTIKKYVSRLKLYFDYLKSLRQITANPWKEAVVYMPTAKNSELERPFTEQEVVTLLTGKCKQALRDVMMMGALTGARLDAVVDLKAGDVIDNKAFRFKPQKREKGERFVPIHSDLMEIVGRRLQGKKPEDDLFPEYPRDPDKPKVERSFRASKHFTTYRRSLGVDDMVAGKRRSRVNFHSFRRWFITKAERSGSPEPLIAAIVGHTRKGMTLGHYSEGPEMIAAREAVERIKLPPLDGSPVIQPEAITPRS
ncbi:tyrosine-type recombinase/integrase [Devosia sp. 1566]|uniref:tyrosine-type recombinase/integrase n=1 Tax=Devosia sp. 1566 TaxID=2499144 RepID=UPI0013E3FD11|nr:tyrosine-type recombinase/integrase [Devosia sp. 1566]